MRPLTQCLGSVIVRVANVTGAGGETSAGGGTLIQGGSNAATNAASQAGSIEAIPGPSTGATQGLQGLNVQGFQYVKGAGTSTQFRLQCPVSATNMTVNDCGASPTNAVGVALAVNSNTVVVCGVGGQCPIAASAAVTQNDTVCEGSTAGKVTVTAAE